MELLTTAATWFTPTTLFLLLNLMIGTLFISSRVGSGHKKHHPSNNPFGLTRAPSLIDRVKSVNFHLYKFPSPETEVFTSHFDVTLSDPHRNPDSNPHAAPLGRVPSIMDRVKSINLSHFKFPQYHPDPDPDPNPNPLPHPTPLVRAPSLLDRVKSINLSHFKLPQYHLENDYVPRTQPVEDKPVGSYRVKPVEDEPAFRFADSVDPPRLARAPSLLERVKSINFSSFYRSDPNYMDHELDPNPFPPKEDHTPRRSKSETKKKSTSRKKMTKSASEKLAETAEETVEAVEKRRPATTRVERSTSIGDGEDSVDAKAADFINKFKQQLKLQRLDSILRYKEMLKAN